jgi:hypothetical protein
LKNRSELRYCVEDAQISIGSKEKSQAISLAHHVARNYGNPRKNETGKHEVSAIVKCRLLLEWPERQE